MNRRDFITTSSCIAAAVAIPFAPQQESEAADVDIFVEQISNTIETNNLHGSQLYFNHYRPSNIVWVWGP